MVAWGKARYPIMNNCAAVSQLVCSLSTIKFRCSRSVRLYLSTGFAWGLKGRMRVALVPNTAIISRKSSPAKVGCRSVRISSGIPNRTNTLYRRADATVLAVTSRTGITSGHFVNWSTKVIPGSRGPFLQRTDPVTANSLKWRAYPVRL